MLRSTAKQAIRVPERPVAMSVASAEAIHLAYLMKTVSGLKDQVSDLQLESVSPTTAAEVLKTLGEGA
jgi:hypothetical protein